MQALTYQFRVFASFWLYTSALNCVKFQMYMFLRLEELQLLRNDD
jgi:hypothetical protein